MSIRSSTPFKGSQQSFFILRFIPGLKSLIFIKYINSLTIKKGEEDEKNYI